MLPNFGKHPCVISLAWVLWGKIGAEFGVFQEAAINLYGACSRGFVTGQRKRSLNCVLQVMKVYARIS
jgi:hypothetical protein